LPGGFAVNAAPGWCDRTFFTYPNQSLRNWPGIFLACDRSIEHRRGAMRSGEAMIDALINVATFVVLVLCITGFGVHRHNVGRRDGRA
jgi:hypothetical protein